MHEQRKGRWLPLPYRLSTSADGASDDGRQYYCDGFVCSGANVAYLSDAVGYSLDFSQVWVWRPVSCMYHLYTALELSLCSSRCSYGHIHVHGDSLAREQYQNLVMLLDDEHSIDLPKVRATAAQLLSTADSAHTATFHLLNSSHTLTVHFDVHDAPVAAHYDDTNRVVLWAARAINGLYQEMESMAACRAGYASQLQQQIQACKQGNMSTQPCFFLPNPTVQHAFKSPQHSFIHDAAQGVSYECKGIQLSLHRGATTAAVDQLMAGLLQQVAEEPHMAVVHADELTRARWDSTHDGMHYSALGQWQAQPCNREQSPQKCPMADQAKFERNWNGGVSNMITMAWVNQLCNRPCNQQGGGGGR